MLLFPFFFFPVRVVEKKEIGHMKTQSGKLGHFWKLLDCFVDTATLKVVGCHIMLVVPLICFFSFGTRKLVIIGLNNIRTGERLDRQRERREREEMIERREERSN